MPYLDFPLSMAPARVHEHINMAIENSLLRDPERSHESLRNIGTRAHELEEQCMSLRIAHNCTITVTDFVLDRREQAAESLRRLLTTRQSLKIIDARALVHSGRTEFLEALDGFLKSSDNMISVLEECLHRNGIQLQMFYEWRQCFLERFEERVNQLVEALMTLQHWEETPEPSSFENTGTYGTSAEFQLDSLLQADVLTVVHKLGIFPHCPVLWYHAPGTSERAPFPESAIDGINMTGEASQTSEDATVIVPEEILEEMVDQNHTYSARGESHDWNEPTLSHPGPPRHRRFSFELSGEERYLLDETYLSIQDESSSGSVLFTPHTTGTEAEELGRHICADSGLLRSECLCPECTHPDYEPRNSLVGFVGDDRPRL